MLRQFLAAETVQVSQEGFLFRVFGVFLLSHSCTVIEAESYVNYTSNIHHNQVFEAQLGRLFLSELL
jgi:hypothetical protein